jgi:class 3 adenylate cyclase
MTEVTEKQKLEIEHKLMQGAVNRASSVSLFFAIAFVLFSFSSFDVLQRFDPDLKIWSNLWPRVIFNGLPFLLLHFYFKRYKRRTKLKLWLWTAALPVVFVSACLIEVWPLIMAGNPDIYLFFHASNAMILTLPNIMVAPSPKFLGASILLFLILFVAPLCFMLIHLNQISLVKFILGDFAFAFSLSALSAQINFKLRKALATEDVLKKQKISKFIGQLVSESIFENNESLIQPRQSQAFLMSVDVRGFTNLMSSTNTREASLFKERYHQIVAKVVGDLGGFIHKTHGDGHLISLGLMSKEVDLSDVPGLETDAKNAEKRKREQQLGRAIVIFERIFGQFEQLRDEFKFDSNVCVCAAIDFGEIGLKLLGDPNVRLEFDLEGMVVFRCARLEAYTKTLREVFQSSNSFLILSQMASSHLGSEMNFQFYKTDDHAIRDFPDEKVISFKEYRRRKFIRSSAA